MKTMMTVITGLIFCMIAQAGQSQKGLEAAIANKMNALLSDTVNEGEGYVKVQERDNKPTMQCSTQPHKTKPKTDVVKCDVEFDVEYGEAKCGASCFLLFTVENKDVKTLKSVSSLEDSCLENLSGTYCD